MTKQTATPAMIPHNERVRIIRDRLRTVRHSAPIKDIPKSKRVQSAEKVLAEWEAKNEAARDAQYKAHQAKRREVENAILLGDAQKAVELLNALES